MASRNFFAKRSVVTPPDHHFPRPKGSALARRFCFLAVRTFAQSPALDVMP
jgi:hypothetical protein